MNNKNQNHPNLIFFLPPLLLCVSVCVCVNRSDTWKTSGKKFTTWARVGSTPGRRHCRVSRVSTRWPDLPPTWGWANDSARDCVRTYVRTDIRGNKLGLGLAEVTLSMVAVGVAWGSSAHCTCPGGKTYRSLEWGAWNHECGRGRLADVKVVRHIASEWTGWARGCHVIFKVCNLHYKEARGPRIQTATHCPLTPAFFFVFSFFSWRKKNEILNDAYIHTYIYMYGGGHQRICMGLVLYLCPKAWWGHIFSLDCNIFPYLLLFLKKKSRFARYRESSDILWSI